MKGIFITFEGPEGAGKTTQVRFLAEYLLLRGRHCITTREPGGTPLAEKLRELVKSPCASEKLADEAELLLFAASRAQHVRHLIQPALAEGKVVLCDRFTDSTTAYQGYARGLDPDFIQRLNDYASCSCKPDITLLLDLDIADGFSRVTSRAECAPGQDRFEAEELSFHKRVREGFLKIAEKEPSRVKILNAKLPPEQVRAQIVEIVNDAFGPL